VNEPNKIAIRRIKFGRTSDSQEYTRIQRGTNADTHPAPANGDDILDLKSSARWLGYSESHLSKILAGKFPDLPPLRHVRAGRTVRIRRGTLLEWFRQAENGRPSSGRV
jgi:hypothetical protein